MRYEKSDELIVAMKNRLMRYRTCAAGLQEATLLRENLFQPRDSDLDKDEVYGKIRTIGL